MLEDTEKHLNHWRLIGRVIEPPKHFPQFRSDPPSLRCKIADLGDDTNHIVLRWDDPEQWPLVEAGVQKDSIIYVEGSLQFSLFTVKGGTERKSLLFNVVRRWQLDPPENSLNEITLVAQLLGDPREDTTSQGRRVAHLLIGWPDEREGIKRMLAHAYLYDNMADEAMLSMGEGDTVFVVGVARKNIWVEGDKHRVFIHAFEAGLGIENQERVWIAQQREQAAAGVIA